MFNNQTKKNNSYKTWEKPNFLLAFAMELTKLEKVRKA